MAQYTKPFGKSVQVGETESELKPPKIKKTKVNVGKLKTSMRNHLIGMMKNKSGGGFASKVSLGNGIRVNPNNY